MKRRSFLKKSALMTGALLFPEFCGASEQLHKVIHSHKGLVLIKLSGGNDGLNTVVPFQNDLYYKARPYLAQRASTLLPLNDELGFHRALKGFKRSYDRGELLVMNNVGFPNLSQSHLAASNMWMFDDIDMHFRYTRERQVQKLNTKINTKINTTYPNTLFGTQLRAIGQAINSKQLQKVYHAAIGGFDTHANQLGTHSCLLKILDEGITALLLDLKKSRKFKDTIIMVYSEFGRSVVENSQKGTDHGNANNVFLFGGSLKKAGVLNSVPNLVDLDANGHLKYEVDCRAITATLLSNWLNLPVNNATTNNHDLLRII